MPSIIFRRAPGIALAVARPPAGRTSGSRLPWMTVVGTSTLAQRLGAVAGGGDRVQLAEDPGGAVAAVVGAAGDVAQALLVERVARGADHGEGLDRPLDRRPRAPAAACRAGRPWPSSWAARSSGCRWSTCIETSERTRSGCSIASGLGDHPAHRGADHVGGVDPEVVHQADRVGGHVAQQVGRGRAAAEPSCRPGSARRRTSILVERPMSRLSKRTTRKPRSASIAQKLLVPGEHLRRQAHHQQQRLAVGVAHLLVGQLDPVGGGHLLVAEGVHHGKSSPMPGCASQDASR